VDRPTVEVYERVARDYAARRSPTLARVAEEFARAVRRGRPRVDLGCGAGRYTALVGAGGPVVALDAAMGMLALVDSPARVCGDLEALPFRSGAFSGAWANVAYQHVAPRQRLPAALAHLHSVLAVGAPAMVSLFTGDGDGPLEGDEFPGRRFVRWPAEDVRPLFEAAGFGISSIERAGSAPVVQVHATRLRTLPDVAGPAMRLFVCGLNPSLYAADAGVPYARRGNRFWPAALAAGIVSRDRDPWHALTAHGVGFTDLVKRPTAGAAGLSAEEYRAGAARLAWTVRLLRPALVLFVGLTGYRSAVDPAAVPGPQAAPFAGAPAHVMPSTSGINAHARLADLVGHIEEAKLRAATDRRG
jgi:TDG/mug DNA glycosylase family protein